MRNFRQRDHRHPYEVGTIIVVSVIAIGIAVFIASTSSDGEPGSAVGQIDTSPTPGNTPSAEATYERPPFVTETPQPGLPPDKSTAFALEQQLLATAWAGTPPPAPPSKFSSPTPDGRPTATWEAGIIDGLEYGPFPASEFEVKSYWKGPRTSQRNGPWMVVYAGALKDPTSGAIRQPAIRVYQLLPTRAPGQEIMPLVGTFEAPILPSAGPLMIVSVNGDIMSLQAEDGTVHSFNLQTRKFL